MRRSDVLAASVSLATLSLVPGSAQAADVAPSDASVWSQAYTVASGAASLYAFRKRATPPRAGAAALPALLLVHGSSMGGRSTFDLSVPGQTGYSMMDAFARLGYDVWTMDFEGYGRSSRAPGNSDIASGIPAMAAVVERIRREVGLAPVHLFGESSGAIRATAFAAAHPDVVGRVATSAYTHTGRGSATLAARAQAVGFYRANNVRPATLELYRSIFTRDHAGTADPAVGDALFEAERSYGGFVPTGTYFDMVTKLPLVDPAAVKAPMLIARGEYDGISTEADLIAFFDALPNNDKQFVVIPGAAHSLVLGYNRDRFWFALHAFLAAPPRRDRVS